MVVSSKADPHEYMPTTNIQNESEIVRFLPQSDHPIVFSVIYFMRASF